MRSMFLPRLLAAALSAVALIAIAPASALAAGEHAPYSAERLAAEQAEGRPVLVDVYADWCPTCRRQEAVLATLLAEPAFAGYRVLRLDWDAQRAEARALGAPRQSTLFVYRDGERVALSVAETDEARLRALLRQGLE